jgi:CheY-like chemotaxis protein
MPAAAPRSPAARRDLQGIRVLVVDDEADARALLRAVLEERGAAVTTASSAPEAFAALAATRPHVILSDIAMPGEDGYALMRRIRALLPEHGGRTPAIALTAYASADDQKRAFTAGYQLHVAKPVDAGELAGIVASLADRAAGS